MAFLSSTIIVPIYVRSLHITNWWYVIVKSHYEEVIVVITQVQGGAEDECNNNYNLRVQWDLTGFYPIVFNVRHITQ